MTTFVVLTDDDYENDSDDSGGEKQLLLLLPARMVEPFQYNIQKSVYNKMVFECMQK